MLTESGDEEEQDHIVNQVLDEIGIDIMGKMKDAPAVDTSLGETANAEREKQIKDQLARLRST